MDTVSTISNILAINFSNDEQTLIAKSLLNIPKTDIKYSGFEQSIKTIKKIKKIDLALINFSKLTTESIQEYSRLKAELQQVPKIIISDDLDKFDINSFGNKVIDIRTLNPIDLTINSVHRELNFQHHRSLFHASRIKAKNEHSRFDAFLNNTEDGVALIHENQYWSVNDAYKRIFNIPAEENLTQSIVKEFSQTNASTDHADKKSALNTSLESLPDNETSSVLIQKRGGESFVTTIYKTKCLVADSLCTQVLVHNPDAWSNIEKGFTDLRSFDHETGIHNKKFIIEHINNKIQKNSTQGSLAVILVNDFRQIRTKYTHQQTDTIIQSIASIIKESCDKTDVLAKYGDSVFTLFSSELDRSDFLLHCQKIIALTNDTLFGEESDFIKVSLSIGISFLDQRVSSAEQLITQADKACDKASNSDGEKINVYDSISTPLNELIEEKQSVNLIQRALEENRLQTLFQPIVDLSEKNTENYAVLLRIIDDDNNHIPPDNFILTAEKTGLISQLDEWVLRNTIQQIRQASRQGVKRKFFINLSINTYKHDQFIETLMADVKFYGIDPSLLVFQINFYDLKDDPAILKKFICIAKEECGCQIAFDQVGFTEITDALLKEYSVDYLKIDGSFTQSLLNEPKSKKIIERLVKITKRNDVKTIAKSVENANVLAILWNIGINAVQGYFLQKPTKKMIFDFSLKD